MKSDQNPKPSAPVKKAGIYTASYKTHGVPDIFRLITNTYYNRKIQPGHVQNVPAVKKYRDFLITHEFPCSRLHAG